jgi:hypothetical protein
MRVDLSVEFIFKTKMLGQFLANFSVLDSCNES